MISVLEKSNNPRILVITPLKKGAKISRDTKISIKRNVIPFTWISFEGDGNPAKNTQDAIDIFKEDNPLPDYLIKLDNDIDLSRGMLDKMVYTLERSEKNVAYAYCSFSFCGVINKVFEAQTFDPLLLMKGNYISFNSLIKTKCLEKIGWLVTNNKYFRLLDWALWLKFLRNGYIGEPVFNACFSAYASSDSVSAGSAEDYRRKYHYVYEDFVKPMLKGS